MIPLKEWIASEEVQELKAKSPGRMAQKEFFRDPFRPIHADPSVFYAPADGIILYALESVKPDEAIVEIKGKSFTPRESLDDPDYKEKSLIIGIFMTEYDVHINRMPTDGYVTRVSHTPFLHTPNISMLLEQNDLMAGKGATSPDMTYLHANERRIVRVYQPIIRGCYYLIQIAEKDVDVILNWGEGRFMGQGDRYGMVRFGSQVDLVIPLNGKAKYEILAKKNHHVLAGIDEIVRITP